ncbi:MAG: EamA family transporter [Victivallales bacterium]|nr:EamA family transporter [Victivallales bacterium]
MPAFLVILAGVSWGLIGVFLRQLTAAGLSTLDICALRVTGAALTLGLGLLFWKPGLLRIRIRDLWCFIGGGCVSVLLFNYCYFLTLQRTSIGVAVTLLYTSPVFVSILSWLIFHEAFTRQKCLAILMMLVGCALVSGMVDGRPALTPVGLLTGLASGLCYGLYSIFGRHAQLRGYTTATITFWNFICATLACCAFPQWGCAANIFAQHPMLWLWAAALVGVATILPYCCYTSGLARMEASRAAVLVAVEPVVGAITGILFFRESLSATTLCGCALVLGAMLVQNIHSPK